MIRRYLRWRRENLEASIVDWEGELKSAQRNGGGNGSRGLECRRVLERLRRRRDRIVRILELRDSEPA